MKLKRFLSAFISFTFALISNLTFMQSGGMIFAAADYENYGTPVYGEVYGSTDTYLGTLNIGTFTGTSYYEQLDQLSKDIYDLLYEAYKDGGSSDEINVISAFEKNGNTTFSSSDNIELEAIDSTFAAYLALSYDHPEFSWISFTRYSTHYSALNYGSYIVLSGVYFNIISGYNYGTPAEMKSAIEKAQSEIEYSTDRYELVANIHDYLCETIEYNYTAADITKGLLYIDGYNQHWYQTAYSAFYPIPENNILDSEADEDSVMTVCAGYSNAFKVLCDSYGIPCLVISGYAGTGFQEAHSWNYVQMEDGLWYAVDVTWDDTYETEANYNYLLIGNETPSTDQNDSFTYYTFDESHIYCTIPYGLNYPVLSDYEYYSESVEKFESPYFEYMLLDDGTAVITGYNGKRTNVVIPSEIDGYKVTSVQGDLSHSCSLFDDPWTSMRSYKIASVKIPDGVVSIGDSAFSGCYYMSYIKIPESVVSIGNSAFTGCGFDTVTLPEGLACIGNSAFYLNRLLTSVEIPDNVTYIGDSAFSSCPSLKSVKLPKGIDTIVENTFMDCTALASIEIPENITEIKDNAFQGCTSLEYVTFFNSETLIPSTSFADCDNIIAVYGYSGSTAQAFAEENNYTFIPFETVVLTDSKNGITVEAEFPAGTVLAVDKAAESVTETSVTYSIYLALNGNEFQPSGPVTVKIPVSDDLKNDTDTYYVFRSEEDNTYTDMNATYSDGYVTFITDNLSQYILATEDLASVSGVDTDTDDNPESGEDADNEGTEPDLDNRGEEIDNGSEDTSDDEETPNDEDVLHGDINSDGAVTDWDSVLLDRYLAGWGNEINKAAADLDGNGTITDWDSVVLARTLAGWY